VFSGAEDVREAIRQEFKFGADWIKVAVTGGVMSAGDNPNVTTMSPEELAAAVDETHRHGKKITVHAIGTEGIKAAVRAGVDNVEHGILIDEEGIALMKERGTWLVPTIYVLNHVIDEGARYGYREESLKKGRELRVERDRRIRAAFAAGIKVAFGSDNIFPAAESAREFAEMVRLGLTPLQAIRTATVSAAEVLGIGKDLGSLEGGKVADVVAVAGNPLENIRLLEDVKFVMQAGRVVKDR
jgi:imidazolonepropionase-like amidohydrolase